MDENSVTEPTGPGAPRPERHGGAEQSAPQGTPVGLDAVLARCASLPDGTALRGVLADVLACALDAFTAPSSTRSPLAEAEPASPAEALAVLGGLDQLESRLAALQALWQVQAEQRIIAVDRAADPEAPSPGRGAAAEIALASRTSPSSASMSLACARRLLLCMPGTFGLLATGDLTRTQATAISTALDGHAAEVASAVDERLVADPDALMGLGFRRTRGLVREVLETTDPNGSRDRADRAARRRNVRLRELPDGMAELILTLRALDAAAVADALRLEAESLRAHGAEDPVGALETDVARDAILTHCTRDRVEEEDLAPIADGPAPDARPAGLGRRRIEVGVIITDRALLCEDNEGELAHIAGYGAIPAHILTDTLHGCPPGSAQGRPRRRHRNPRPEPPAGEGSSPARWEAGRPGSRAPGGGMADPELADAAELDPAAAAVFRRLYTHPVSGEMVAMDSRARAFPVSLERLIRLRDATCRMPWCNARVRQIDHVTAHSRGGSTAFANGQGLCIRCNLLKEHGPWALEIQQPLPQGRGPAEQSASDTAENTSAGTTAEAAAPASAESPATRSTGRTGIRWQSPHGAVGFSPTPAPGSVGPPHDRVVPRDPIGGQGVERDVEANPARHREPGSAQDRGGSDRDRGGSDQDSGGSDRPSGP